MTDTALVHRLPSGMPTVTVDYILLAAVLLVGVDSALALRFWHLESNPILLALGPVVGVTIKSVAATVALVVWFAADLRTVAIARWCAWFLFGLHALLAVSNAAVVLIR